MTLSLFLILFTILCSVSALLTEALKVATSQTFSANLIAFIDAIVVGGGGTAAAFIWAGTPFTLQNILAIVCMVAAIWIGSMIGYDKVKQLITQIINNNGKDN